MDKRLLTRLTCFSMALAVILGGSTLYYGRKASVCSTYISLQNQRALSRLLESVDNLDSALRKTACVPAGEMRSLLAAEIWRQCESAKAAMSVLPLSDTHLEKTEKYLAQAGDYAYYLLRQGVYGGTSENDVKNLATLATISAALVPQLSALKERADTGDAVFEAVIRGQSTATAATDAFVQTETSFPEYEGLSYDGPFSEHISQMKPKLLDGLAECSPEQARAVGSALLDTNDLQLQYEGDGEIPYYCFSAGDGRTLCITKVGGKLLALTDERQCGESVLTPDEAVKAGDEWLAAHGYDRMVSTYYTLSGGTANINYVSTQDDAVVYPDLITLSVALDDGSVMRADARGYLMNHIVRTAPSVDLSGSVPPEAEGMEVLSQRQAVIPTAGKNEVWCHEYLCQLAGGKALIYVGCESGKVENVLLLVENETGTLTR
ncbi:MAG: germination protein YpeB [Clostridiaceae bacterium]|nr:germination protein YpeB [Clostridiaceae bacterium]